MTISGQLVRQSVGQMLHTSNPSELLHFDFLTLPETGKERKNILVFKDNMDDYVELVKCSVATADEVCRALLDRFI
jgi:hypothetical protein